MRSFSLLTVREKTFVAFSFCGLLFLSLFGSVLAFSNTDVTLGSGDDVFNGNLSVVGDFSAANIESTAPIVGYSFLIYQDGLNYKAKAGNGTVCFTSTDTGIIFNNIFSVTNNANIKISTGTYIVNTPIIAPINPHIWIQGAGKLSTIFTTSQNPAPLWTFMFTANYTAYNMQGGAGNATMTNVGDYFKLSDFTINLGTYSWNGIYFRNLDQSQISSLEVVSSKSTDGNSIGIEIENAGSNMGGIDHTTVGNFYYGYMLTCDNTNLDTLDATVCTVSFVLAPESMLTANGLMSWQTKSIDFLIKGAGEMILNNPICSSGANGETAFYFMNNPVTNLNVAINYPQYHDSYPTGFNWFGPSGYNTTGHVSVKLSAAGLWSSNTNIATETWNPNYSGIVTTLTVNQAVNAGQLLFRNTTGYFVASATSINTMLVTGIALEPANSGAKCLVLLSGYYYNTAFSGLTVGSVIYAATSTGTLTNTVPSSSGNIVQPLGYVSASNEIYFQPNPPTWVTIA